MTEAIRKRQYTGDALKSMDAMSTVGITSGHFAKEEWCFVTGQNWEAGSGRGVLTRAGAARVRSWKAVRDRLALQGGTGDFP